MVSPPIVAGLQSELVSPQRLGITFAVHVLFFSGIAVAVGPFRVG